MYLSPFAWEQIKVVVSVIERRWAIIQIRQNIIDDIKQHISKNGGDYTEWYVGVCKDPLFLIRNMHRMNRFYWMYKPVDTVQMATEVMDHFINLLGVNSDSVRSCLSEYSGTVYIYVYKNSEHTVLLSTSDTWNLIDSRPPHKSRC